MPCRLGLIRLGEAPLKEFERLGTLNGSLAARLLPSVKPSSVKLILC